MEPDNRDYWLPIPGYKGQYDVSVSGRVRSLDRLNVNRNGIKRRLRGKLLAAAKDSNGYPQVALLRNGVESKVRVHRLVALVFIKNPNGLPLVDHRNRNRHDNRICNLRWASLVQNRQNRQNSSRDYDRNDAALADMKRLAEEE